MTKTLTRKPARAHLSTLVARIKENEADIINTFVAIGLDLKTIRDDELFKPDYDDFPSFIHGELSYMDQKTRVQDCWFRIRAAEVFTAIGDKLKKEPEDIRKIVRLPWSQHQLRPLFKLNDRKAAEVYIDLSIHADKVRATPTGEFVRDFVRNESHIKRAKVLDIESDTAIKDADFSAGPSEQTDYSPEAKDALLRVEQLSSSVFPEGAREMIEQELAPAAKPLTSYELELWNRHEREDFIKIGRLLFSDRGLTYDETERFVLRPLSESSRITDLVNAAVSAGGDFKLQLNDKFVIVVTSLVSATATLVA